MLLARFAFQACSFNHSDGPSVVVSTIRNVAVQETIVHAGSRSERSVAGLHSHQHHSPPLSACASRDRELRSGSSGDRVTKASVDEHRGIQRKTPLSGRVNCDRTVIGQAWNLEEHRGLRTHTE